MGFHKNTKFFFGGILRSVFVFLILAQTISCFAADQVSSADLERGFSNPPVESRIRAYWWWLNGNVTPESISRDLQEMKKLGWGGALVCDADGSNQRGNRQVPAGPLYASPEWRKLMVHALQEAEKQGLALSIGIQSGWNVGGPAVQPETAAKHVVWSETQVDGGSEVRIKLPQPKHDERFYRDIAIVGYKMDGSQQSQTEKITYKLAASSSQSDHPPTMALDDKPETFWVSAGSQPGEGPTPKNPVWLEFQFSKPVTINGISILGRPGYGPQECELQASTKGQSLHSVKEFNVHDGRTTRIEFKPVEADTFRLLIPRVYEPYYPDQPRNAQVAELTLHGENQNWPGKTITRKPIKDFLDKIAVKELDWSCPVTTYLLMDDPPQPGEEDAHIRDVVDLSKYMNEKEEFNWAAPPGKWQILRFGYSLTGAQVSTSSKGWSGLVIDYLDPDAFRTYWNQVAAPLMADAAPWLGKSLKYLQTDSWEAGGMNWSKNFREEFRERRGYDLLPFLPILAGRIVENRAISNRFLNDFRRTIGDCVADNHYGVYDDLAHQNKLGIHPESGGPHGAPIDALKCLGRGDFPMMEFWAKSPQHRIKDEDRFFTKQGSSAAHIYGKKWASAEGFTNIGLHWEESLGTNLKPSFDRAACEGFNCLYWHAFTCSPDEAGLPGQEYFAGTHCNPKVTWWKYSGDFVKYMNRCQYLLQQGLFVADACYYYGDNVPNFVQLKTSDPARVLPRYDYDVMNEEVLLNRLQVRDGRLVLPDGMSYRVMVLPGHQIISLEALRKLAQLVEQGATIIGPKPISVTGLKDYPSCDVELVELANQLWGHADGRTVTQNVYGKGRVIWWKSAKDILATSGILPDFECYGDGPQDALDYIHRVVGDIDIYFIANSSNQAKYYQCTFRVENKAPELWLPDTGEISRSMLYICQKDKRLTMPIYLEPYGSTFVVFRSPAGPHFTSLAKDGKILFPYSLGTQIASPIEVFADKDGKAVFETREKGNYELKNEKGQTFRIAAAEPLSRDVAGPWQVHFEQGWGAPESIAFDTLKSWTENADPNIKYFSGTATYIREIDIPADMLESKGVLELDLGDLREMAQVSVNGQALGVLWKAPFRVDIGSVAKAGKNSIEVKVVNEWVNRLIGDSKLPPDQRKTKTNITKYDKGDDRQLLPSGLFGPVTLRKIPVVPCSGDK
jgi:hypothetical protein